jgi:hypothetical protein
VDVPGRNNLSDPISLCVNRNHFPLSNEDYFYYLHLEIKDRDSGEVLATYNTDVLQMESVQQAVRITNLRYADISIDPEEGPGFSVNFTLEAFGYKNKTLILALFVADDDGQFVKNVVPDSKYRTPDGDITYQKKLSPNHNYAIWGDWLKENSSIDLYLPFSIFPHGNYRWHPVYLVFEEGREEEIFTLNDPHVIEMQEK